MMLVSLFTASLAVIFFTLARRADSAGPQAAETH